MIEFRLAPHSSPGSAPVCEIYRAGEFVGCIYPSAVGIRVISKYLTNDGIFYDKQPPSCVNVLFANKPQTEEK